MERYQNRQVAGELLAAYLDIYANRADVEILALPRGGVPVAYEVAKKLCAPLDVFIVRKLGVPGHDELAMGALAEGDQLFFNDYILQDLKIPTSAIEEVIAQERQELARRQLAYRGNHKLPNIKDKIVILIDDGVATGATMRVAINALKKMQPKKIIVAIPVADKTFCEMLAKEVDELVCPLRPHDLYAVGIWYVDFSQTEDEEVQTLLKKSERFFNKKTNID